ncbi:transporter [Marinobacter zhejiangensis]|uniref:MetA-pathway of phenol degradation n=1 Tax=Marinobacter zhejiangensis TaxID=488535 RepID=A0A1I4KYR7_9GAMM|nr:transporter [Marinobacter zhejiangensis]SFL83801.1 hypothetical protein SAMN04487963_0159 [Marinobacter zhejiangensis]
MRWTKHRLGLTLLACIFGYPVFADDYDDYGAPESEQYQPDKASEIASITTDRGIVTRPGKLTVEPAFSHAYSNSTVVAIEGYTVIPALVVGLINITEVQRDIFIAALSLKYGISSRLETGLRIPYLSIQEDHRERQAFQGTPLDNLRESDGEGLGDVEWNLRYQFNDGLAGWPYVIGNFLVRAPTGENPYEVDRRELLDDQGNVVGIVLAERPTGSGFWSFEPGLSFIYPSDPAVLFGNVSYGYTLKDDKGPENGGTINPGNVTRFGFGMGFAFNERTSFSLGYDHSVIPKTSLETGDNLTDTQFDRIQIGSLSFGLSQQFSRSTSMNLTVSIGVTEQAPNSEISVKFPLTF